MIVKNTLEDVIIHIYVNVVSREIIRDFFRKKIKVENLQGLKKGETSIGGKLNIFEGIKCDHSLQDYIIFKCEEYDLENITNMDDCTLTSILLKAFTKVKRKIINRE